MTAVDDVTAVLPATLATVTAEASDAATVTVACQAAGSGDFVDLLAALGLPSDRTALGRIRATLRPAAAEDTPTEDVPDQEETPVATQFVIPNEVIQWGSEHSSARIRGLAARALKACEDLAAAREELRIVDQEQAEVDRLAAELEAAKARLKAAKAGATVDAPKPAKKPRSEAQTAAALKAGDTSRIRAWARKNGHDVSPVGIVPRAVVDAYNAAHA